jgi:hypothetical protein
MAFRAFTLLKLPVPSVVLQNPPVAFDTVPFNGMEVCVPQMV